MLRCLDRSWFITIFAQAGKNSVKSHRQEERKCDRRRIPVYAASRIGRR